MRRMYRVAYLPSTLLVVAACAGTPRSGAAPTPAATAQTIFTPIHPYFPEDEARVLVAVGALATAPAEDAPRRRIQTGPLGCHDAPSVEVAPLPALAAPVTLTLISEGRAGCVVSTPTARARSGSAAATRCSSPWRA